MSEVDRLLLALLLGPPDARHALECRFSLVLLIEAPDPNRSRILLRETAQTGVLRHELAAAQQITDEVHVR